MASDLILDNQADDHPSLPERAVGVRPADNPSGTEARPPAMRSTVRPLGRCRSTLVRIALRDTQDLGGLLSARERTEALDQWQSRLTALIVAGRGTVLRHAERYCLARFSGNDLEQGNHAVRAIRTALLAMCLPDELAAVLALRFDHRAGGPMLCAAAVQSCQGDAPDGEPTSAALAAVAYDLAQVERQIDEANWLIAIDPDSLRVTGERFVTGRAMSFSRAHDAGVRTLIEVTGFEVSPASTAAEVDQASRVQAALGSGAQRARVRKQARQARAEAVLPGALHGTPGDLPIPDIEGYGPLTPLGKGGMSRVFVGRHQASGELRVLKTVPLAGDDDLLQRFLQEYALIAQVRHPNVALIYEQGFAEDCAYIAMEHLAGGSLHDRIGRGLSVEEVLSLMIQITLGLTTIHDRGIIHRDLKPENLMFRADGLLVLADFGIARQSSTHLTATQQGLVYGTPYYMSPEQATGRAVDARSDLYSLGVIFHELVTGNRPFDASCAEAVAYQQVHARPPSLPARAGRLQSMHDRLLAKDPAARYGSAAEVLADLRIWLAASRTATTLPLVSVGAG